MKQGIAWSGILMGRAMTFGISLVCIERMVELVMNRCTHDEEKDERSMDSEMLLEHTAIRRILSMHAGGYRPFQSSR